MLRKHVRNKFEGESFLCGFQHFEIGCGKSGCNNSVE
jgi:hypothetical protein